MLKFNIMQWRVTGDESKPEGPAVDGNERAVFETNEKRFSWLHGVVDDGTGDHQTSSQRQHCQTAHQLETQQDVGDKPRHQRRPARSHNSHTSVR